MTFAARVMGIKPLVGSVSTIIAGLVLDRTRKHHIVPAFACMLQMVAFVLLAYMRHPGVAYTHAALNVVGSAIGPVVLGAAFDSLGGYTKGIIGLSVLPLIAGVLSLFIRPPAVPTIR